MTEAFRGEPIPPEEPKKFWWGSDFITTEAEQTINGSGEIQVYPFATLLGIKSYPIDGQIRGKRIANKSRNAQWGVEVTEDSVESIADNEDEAKRTFFRKPATVTVKSHTGNRIVIPPSTPLFALYSQGPSITGEELVDMVGSGRDVDIDGKQGKAWKFVYKNPYSKRPEDVTGVAVQIRNDRRWYIPPGGELNLADLAAAGRNYREVVDSQYRAVPRDRAVDIWFGELPDLRLSHNVAVELAKPVAPNLNVSADIEAMERQRLYPNGRHIGARLLHPGSGLNNPEGWPIRVEIDTRGSVQKPGAVIFRVMRAA